MRGRESDTHEPRATRLPAPPLKPVNSWPATAGSGCAMSAAEIIAFPLERFEVANAITRRRNAQLKALSLIHNDGTSVETIETVVLILEAEHERECQVEAIKLE